MDNDSKKKKAKGTNTCIIKRILKFSDNYDSIFENKNMLTSQQRLRSDHHTIYTEKINKIAIYYYYLFLIYLSLTTLGS